MDILDQNASTCCQLAFARLADSGKLGPDSALEDWTCPRCGCQYRAEFHGPCIRYWRFVLVASVIRP